MGDEELLAQWYKARGRQADRLPPEQEAAILRNLRIRRDDLDNPKPLGWCPICQVDARGEHQQL